MIKIRKVRLSDVCHLEKLFLKVRQQTFKWKDAENFRIEDYKTLTSGEKVFVAEVDKKIAGFVSVWQDESGSFVHNLFVYPDFQGMGLGKLLLSEAVEISGPPITLKVDIANIKACKFYESQGWRKISTDDTATAPYYLYGLRL